MLTIRGNQSGPIEHKNWNGKDFIVAPFVAIYEGVWNGEFVPGPEIERSVPGWNGRPVVLDHPKRSGDFISANEPDLLAASPGMIFNARWENGKLKFETWIDPDKAPPELVTRLQGGEMIEGSTGYFRDIEDAVGEIGGRPFAGIARNLIPDHYAILLNDTGACSLADGCGGPRVNLAVNEQDFSDSVMIAFYPSSEIAQTLALTGEGFPEGSVIHKPADLHLTLAYLGKVDEMPYGEDVALMELGYWAESRPIVRAVVNGLIQFNRGGQTTEDGRPLRAVCAAIDGSYLANWRNSLVGWMSDMFPVDGTYGFNPHITLAYIPEGEAVNIPVPPPTEMIFDSVALSWGNRVTVFKLRGEPREMDSEEMMGNKNRKSFKDRLVEIAGKLGLNFRGDSDMAEKKCELIKALVEAGKINDKTAKVLEQLEPDAIKALVGEPETLAPEPTPAQPETPAPDYGQTLAEIREALAGLRTDVDGLKTGIQANQDQELAELVDRLAETQQVYSKEELTALGVNQLRKLESLLTPANYGGIPAPRQRDSGEWEDYQVPELNGQAK